MKKENEFNDGILQNKGVQIRSKKRVKEHAEVFTNEREVKAMCDLIPDFVWKNVDKTFLEPACGDGNFLKEIIERKLKVVKSGIKKTAKSKAGYFKDSEEYNKFFLRTFMSIYGIELMSDNTKICRKRLYEIALNWLNENSEDEINKEMLLKNVKFILSKNIVNGNALTMRREDIKNEKGINYPIAFCEWEFIDNKVKRRDFYFEEIIKNQEDDKKLKKELSDKEKFKIYQQNPKEYNEKLIPPDWKPIIYTRLFEQEGKENDDEYINRKTSNNLYAELVSRGYTELTLFRGV